MKKTVLISGGTKGIGKESVICLLRDGFNVVTFSRDAKGVSELEKDLKQEYSADSFLVLRGDVTSQSDMEGIVKKTLEKFKTLDILINNAGYGYWAEADKVDIEKFKALLATNVVGLALLTRTVVPQMKKQKRGLIVNISSISGRSSYPQGEFYSSTKHAVMGYSEGIRKELREFGIKVSTVCPGPVKTDFIPEEELKRREKMYGDKVSQLAVEDLAKVISFVCQQPEHSDIQDISISNF